MPDPTDSYGAPILPCCMARHVGQVCSDGTFMCCLCFEKVQVADAFVELDGTRVDCCKPCGERDQQTARKGRSEVDPVHAADEPPCTADDCPCPTAGARWPMPDLTDSYARLVQVRCPDYMSLFCDDCGRTFITYDPNAERGHPVQLGAMLDDATRHARECPQADKGRHE